MKYGQHKPSYYVINGITFFRVIAAPFLLALLFTGRYDLFKWLLGLSFFTDLIDGYLARKYKVTSIFGARLDSLGDDLTVLIGIIGLFVMKPAFIKEQIVLILLLLVLLLIQIIYAFIRYGKMTNFHTYLAKTAAVLQGIFLLLTFFTGKVNLFIFFAAAIVTALELIEEIILTRLLPDWKANIKGLYRVIQKKKQETGR
jgi:phosphatidylglycerophosphate synthase